MDRNAKIFSAFSIVIVIIGIGLLFLAQDSAERIEAPVVELTPIPTIATFSAVVGIEGQRMKVTKVVDGDTIEVEGDVSVRLIGIDTPETVDPRRPVGCFGKEASNEAKNLLSGKEVILQKDVSETDKYKRLLRYVYLALEDGKLLFINDYLVREGFAKVLTYPPDVKFNEQFLRAEKQAREQNKGLWGKCDTI